MGRLAFTDDTQLVPVRFERRWTVDGEVEHTDVRLWSITAVDDPGVCAQGAVADEAAGLAAAIAAARGMPADAVRLATLVVSMPASTGRRTRTRSRTPRRPPCFWTS
jgi:hypothetical protein